MKFAAPSDFLARPSGLSGLRQRYGLDIAPGNFVAISDDGGAVTVRTLEQGKVNAANIFSTSPAILQHQLVATGKLPDNTFRFEREGNHLRFHRRHS